MNSKSANTTIAIKVPGPAGGRNATAARKTRKNKRRRRGKLRQRIPPDLANHMDDYHYAASLVDPWGVLGARIPDNITTASFTARSFVRFNVPVYTAVDGSAGAGVLVNLTISDALSSTGAILTATAGGATSQFKYTAYVLFPNYSGIVTNGAAVRMVSAGLSIVPTGALVDTQGTVVAGLIPRQASLLQYNTNYTRPNLDAQLLIRTCPVKPATTCTVTWQPPENGFNIYRATNESTNYGQMFANVFGCKTTASFEATVVINWEVLPNVVSQGLIPIMTSKCSYKAMEIASNVMATRSIFHTSEQDVYDASIAGAFQGPDDGGVTAGYVLNKFMSSSFTKDYLEPVANGIRNSANTLQLVGYTAQAARAGLAYISNLTGTGLTGGPARLT
jgi:hypothetical protein